MKKIIILIICSCLIYSCEESQRNLKHSWTIEELYVNDISFVDSLKVSHFIPKPEVVFQSKGKILLPDLIWIEPSPAQYKCTWEFKRKGLEGQVKITDKSEDYFSGTYDIEILEHNPLLLIRLKSDSIEFILREQQGFSLNRTVIPH